MMICNRFIYLTYISFFSHIAGVPQVSKYLTCQSNPKRAASLHVQWWISSSDCQLTFPIALWLKVVALQCISYYVTSQPSPKRAPGLHVQWRSSLHGYQLTPPIVSWLKVVVLQKNTRLSHKDFYIYDLFYVKFDLNKRILLRISLNWGCFIEI